MADYVVTRKRKRYAVDPCLGYYLYAPSNDDREESSVACSNLDNEGIAHAGIHARLEPECTKSTPPRLMNTSYESGNKTTRGNNQGGRSNQAQLQEEDVLTVDAFLKRSTKDRTTKTYRHWKLLKRGVDDCEIDARSENAIQSSKHDSKNTRRKNCKPLKERLYEAAVVTRGNPDDFYTHSEAAQRMASNQVALVFVPDEDSLRDRHVAGKTHTKAFLVDPRRSMAMQTTSLTWCPHRGYADGGLLSNTLDRIPLSKWNLTLNDNEHAESEPGLPTERKETKTTGDMATMGFNYPPLTFVSFQEAEKNYKTMFPGAGHRNGNFLKQHTLADIASTPEGKDAYDWSLAPYFFAIIFDYIDDDPKCLVQVNQAGPPLVPFPISLPFEQELSSLPPLISKLCSRRLTPQVDTRPQPHNSVSLSVSWRTNLSPVSKDRLPQRYT